MTMGTLLAIVGFVMYSHLKLRKQQQWPSWEGSILPLANSKIESKKDSGIVLPHIESKGLLNDRREEKIRAHPTSL